MITVYRVKCVDGSWPGSKPYQGIVLDERVFKTEAERVQYHMKYHYFEGVRKTDWNPAPMEPWPKKLPEPDIWYFDNGAFAVWAELLKKIPALERILNRAGQLLPQPFKGKELVICNILECVNCIDEEKTQYPIPGTRRGVPIPYFVTSALPKSALFKIPQAPTQIFAWEDSNSIDPENDFKACVEKHKLTSIYFRPAWSEAEGVIRRN
jgi:hypothetical protein